MKQDNNKYIKIPDWIYWGSDRVVLRYKNPDGQWMESEFLPMDYPEIETEQSEQLKLNITDLQSEIEKLHEHYREEIRRLRDAYPYRGKPVVTVDRDGTSYRMQILEAHDTPEGLVIRGRI